jgi:hypothetical protein
MTRLPFIVTHCGISLRCNLMVDSKGQVKLIEVADLSRADVERMFPEGLPDLEVIDRCQVAVRAVRDKVGTLNDLIHADMPFDALASCRRSPGLYGAILDPAWTELENLRTAQKGEDDAGGA